MGSEVTEAPVTVPEGLQDGAAADAVGEASEQCSICLEALANGALSTLVCGHMLHTVCLVRTCRRGQGSGATACPMCRVALDTDAVAEPVEEEDVDMFVEDTLETLLHVRMVGGSDEDEREHTRLMRAYYGRVSRAMRVSEQLRALRQRARDARRGLLQDSRALEREWRQAERAAWNSAPVLEARRQHTRARARQRHHERRYEDALREAVGARPNPPMFHFGSLDSGDIPSGPRRSRRLAILNSFGEVGTPEEAIAT